MEQGRVVTGPVLAERGRVAAAHELANNPAKRKEIEEAFGVEICRQMYPEVYRNIGSRTGFASAFDKVRSLLRW